ncbi:class I SAM-dependent DNA methyltransferase [Chryseobacterium sp. CFBP8996]|uniref:class I SAM-dependent DNA methyltransferase n=1 Tax=Chryseobacterium sp. CFBP8996 TaxID=3096529 RepID=UPI002A69D35F|nr:methyltransferase domain-containing protein [Chryseobacterium sp. CFBP8996]MDY0931025.1 methyltransferase domain-containing protein [Chryseobacterium sp. CFBP8996]
MIKKQIHRYYNDLAKTYDENRFENSYGKYIDQQERHFLDSFFKNKSYSQVLDLGCGTGRLLNFATHGVDFSQEMLTIAHQKFPHKNLAVGEISNIPFDEKFDCIFSFHVIMHQTKEETKNFLNEAYKSLNNEGILIFDFPINARKKPQSPQEDWHANNSFSTNEISDLLKHNWKVIETKGILFFPVHRIPKSFRKIFLPLDIMICRTFLKKWASYQIIALKKK